MAALIIPLFIAIFFTYALQYVQTTPTDEFYWAAVVEYHGSLDRSQTPIENCKNNLESYVKIIKKAKEAQQDLDIIVFPEIGLVGYDKTLLFEIPDPKLHVIPAANETWNDVIRTISKAAIDNKVYILVNLHESFKNKSKDYKFNTNVVFSRTGEVIARYRKYNLFGEFFLDKPKGAEYVTFDTDFGVKFGTFTCFDIIFEEPAIGLVQKYNITDVIFPTAWFSELPFHYGVQEQFAWAYANNVNLLASGYNNLTSGNTGSGIYAGRKGSIVYTQDVSSGSRILIGKVPKMSAGESKIAVGQKLDIDPISVETAPIVSEDIRIFKSELLAPEKMRPFKQESIKIDNVTTALKKNYSLEETLCDNNFCCNFSLKFSAQYYQDNYNFKDDVSFNKRDAYYHYRFRLVAFDGIRTYIVGNSSGEQVCAIMPCLNDSLNSCAKPNTDNQPTISITDKDLGKMLLYSTEFNFINISGYFHNKRVLFLPSVLLTSKEEIKPLNPNQFQLNIKNSTDKTFVNLLISNLSMDKFASGGILARLFERDNKFSKPSSASTLQIYSPLLVTLIPLIF